MPGLGCGGPRGVPAALSGESLVAGHKPCGSSDHEQDRRTDDEHTEPAVLLPLAARLVGQASNVVVGDRLARPR